VTNRGQAASYESAAFAAPKIIGAELSQVRGDLRQSRLETTPGSVAPFAVCMFAGFVLACTPIAAWRIQTGDWVCLNDGYTPYYLRLASQAYYGHSIFLNDIVVPEGVTGYPWLTFVPFAELARVLGVGPFAVNIIWILFTAVALSTTLYLLFRRFLQHNWTAAACTVLCLSDYGFAAGHPFTTQSGLLLSALWTHPHDLVVFPWNLLLHWRVPDPGLDLPFMFVQILAVARAREEPNNLNLSLSGIAFGLLFYVFFYCWSLAAAGLALAFLLDSAGRGVYLRTFAIGVAIGIPQLLYSIHLSHLAPAEAMQRFGIFTRTPRLFELTFPAFSLLAVIAAAVWIWTSERRDLIYLLSLAFAGITLSRSRAITGVFFHEYHYTWFWTPVRLILVLIIAASLIGARYRPRIFLSIGLWIFIALYLAGGAYIAAICTTRTPFGINQVRSYIKYKDQRILTKAAPLSSGATIAGDDSFCELAGVAEDLRVLAGNAVPISMSVDNAQWEQRAALNAVLLGTGRAQFEKQMRGAVADYFWKTPGREPEMLAGFMRSYDEISRDPGKYIARFGIRYFVLPADDAYKGYSGEGWMTIQAGPYWRILERRELAH
jgi:hypothetical protein